MPLIQVDNHPIRKPILNMMSVMMYKAYSDFLKMDSKNIFSENCETLV